MSNLKALIKQSGIKQQQIAAACDRSQGAVSQWVTGARRIPAECVPAIEALTGIPRHELRPDLWPAPATTDAPTFSPLAPLQADV